MHCGNIPWLVCQVISSLFATRSIVGIHFMQIHGEFLLVTSPIPNKASHIVGQGWCSGAEQLWAEKHRGAAVKH
jgi:hypothetical protein